MISCIFGDYPGETKTIARETKRLEYEKNHGFPYESEWNLAAETNEIIPWTSFRDARDAHVLAEADDPKSKQLEALRCLLWS